MDARALVLRGNGQSVSVYYHRAAQWTKPGYNVTGLELVVPQADDADLCDGARIARYDFIGKAVLGLRGNCSFAQKAASLDKTGAAAMIIGNYYDQLITMAGESDVTFPCVLVEATTYTVLAKHSKPMSPDTPNALRDTELTSSNELRHESAVGPMRRWRSSNPAPLNDDWLGLVDVNRIGAVSDILPVSWAIYAFVFLVIPVVWCLFLCFLCMRRRVAVCLLRSQTQEAVIYLPLLVFRKPAVVATSAKHYGLVPTEASLAASSSNNAAAADGFPTIEFVPAPLRSYFAHSLNAAHPTSNSNPISDHDMFPDVLGFVEGKVIFSRDVPPPDPEPAQPKIIVSVTGSRNARSAVASTEAGAVTTEATIPPLQQGTATMPTNTLLIEGVRDERGDLLSNSASPRGSDHEGMVVIPLLPNGVDSEGLEGSSAANGGSASAQSSQLAPVEDEVKTRGEDLGQIEVLPQECLKALTRIHSDSCTVCLEEYEDGITVKVLPCRHAFHNDCIQPWLAQRSDQCPTCKQSIRRAMEPLEGKPCHERFLRFVLCLGEDNGSPSPGRGYICCCIPAISI